MRNAAILLRASMFSFRMSSAFLWHFLIISSTSASAFAPVSSEQVRLVLPFRYILFSFSRAIISNVSLIPNLVTIALASSVALSISLDAPVVTFLNIISSAPLPARRAVISSSISSFVIRYLSSSGICIVYPREPIVLGTMVIFCTGWVFFWQAMARACPTSW